MRKTRFEWDDEKDKNNEAKHGVSFTFAQRVFLDPRRVIAQDLSHSETETRYYCMGEIEGNILTVRFTFRRNVIHIFGAGSWRKGKRIYEEKNKIHQGTHG
jgi:uncharacterized DUF497 family protein